jgi:hypothetical protein
MRVPAVAALLLLASAPARPGTVEVRSTEAGLDVRADAAPLADILERISRQTGMKVVYDGTPMRSPVTATVERASAAEAVLSLLEGQGVSYALIMDPTGTKVETLMLVAPSAGGVARSAPAAPGRRQAPLRLPEPPVEEPEVEEPVAVQEEPAPDAQPGAEDPGAELPGSQATPYPVSPFAPQPVLPFGPAPGQPGAPQPGTPGPTEGDVPEAVPTPPPPPEPR